MGAGELDPIEALALDRKAAGERSVALAHQRQRTTVAQQDLAIRGRHRRHDVQHDVRAADRGDVATLGLPRREAGIGGEAVFEIELRYRRQIHHREHELA